MLKTAGVFLVFAGCLMQGVLETIRIRLRLQQLKQAVILFQTLKSEITYGKTALAEACREAAGHMAEPYADFLRAVYEAGLQNQGSAFAEIWTRELKARREEFLLGEEEMALLEQFGACSGFMDIRLQESGTERIGRELEQHMIQEEREKSNRIRVSLSLSAAGGAVLIMILL